MAKAAMAMSPADENTEPQQQQRWIFSPGSERSPFSPDLVSPGYGLRPSEGFMSPSLGGGL
jgi:hypothetical protein